VKLHTRLNAVLLLCLCSVSALAQQIKLPTDHNTPGHPRLLLFDSELSDLKKTIASNETWTRMHNALIEESMNIMNKPPLERIQIGRRLLSTSREALRRIFYLSYVARMTGENKFSQRAEKEMLAIASFTDWNPSHFLDVAEMTMAMAIGYDWLYGKLSEQSRKTIETAIMTKGIAPSYDEKYNFFLSAVHNWNQVCNAGMTFGAIALADVNPELAHKTIERSLNTIHLPMEEYKPDGAYPEGYSYWGYGTSFNVLFLSAIEKLYGTDFDLSKKSGFLNTATFLENMVGPTGQPFNWGDCGSSAGLSVASFWFAEKNHDSSLLWQQKQILEKENYSGFTNDRILPAVMIWGKNIEMQKVTPPGYTTWIGQGANPVALMRTSWSDPKSIYLGFKTGSPSVNHGHMDIGSFVMEADGIRWAADFGMQEYESLESKGIQVFGRTQDAQRWTIFRLNNFAHNTLTFDNELQRVKGYAKIDRASTNRNFPFAISDISSVYEGQVAAAKRGVGIVEKKFVIVRDEIKNSNKKTTMRWTMLTHAGVVIANQNTIILKQEGEELHLRFESSTPITLKTWSTEPTTDYDAANPGTTLIGFETILEPNQVADYTAYLISKSALKKFKATIKNLDSWQ
jgi:hypothetical protein